MYGFSKNETKALSELEFHKKFYFSLDDIQPFFSNTKQMYNTVYSLRKKKRIFRLSQQKYFLIPFKAPQGKWTDNPRRVVDEMFDGKDYFVGGWYAANYWGLTEQVPMQMDVYTTKRQGKVHLLNERYVFHRTSAKRREISCS